MGCLVDTDVISELARRKPDQGVIAGAGGVTRLAISVITIDATHFGLARRPNERVRAWVEAFFQRHPLLEVTAPIAQRAGELRGALAARGSIRHQADMLIAATAQVRQRMCDNARAVLRGGWQAQPARNASRNARTASY